MTTDKNTFLLGNKDDNIHVQTNRKKKYIFISKTSKIISMSGNGNGRKKGTDIFYVLHNGKSLICGFGDCISKCSFSVPFTPGENSSPWTLIQNGNRLCAWKTAKESKSENILIFKLFFIKAQK